MKKKVGWIFIIGAILLFVINFFTLGVFITAKWTSMASTLIGFIICPVLIFIGIVYLIMGKK